MARDPAAENASSSVIASSQGRLSNRLRAAAREYAARVRDFSPNARLFLGAAALGGLNVGVSSVLLNLYVLSLGYSEGFLGRLLSFGPLAAIPAALVAGPLIDGWGARRAMLGGSAFTGAGALILLASSTPAALRAGVALASMGGVLIYIAVPPFLARHSSPRERAHLFSVTAAAYVVSTASGSMLGGFLPRVVSAVWPSVPQAQGYRLALFGGALCSALAIPLLALVRESRGELLAPLSNPAAATGQPVAQESSRQGRQWYLASWLHRRSLGGQLLRVAAQFMVTDGLIRLGANLIVPFFNVFFVRHLGASEAWYGTLRFAERAIEVVAMLLVAPLAARFGPVTTITLTQLFSVPMLLALGFAPTLAIASGAFLLRGTLMEMTVPIRDSFMMDVVPDAARATANAMITLTGYAIAFASTRAGGRLLEAGHYGTACGITAVLYVVSAALYWRFFSATPQAVAHRTQPQVAVAG